MYSITDRLKDFFSRIRNYQGEPSNRDMVLGQVLRRKNIITEDQLHTALTVQKDKFVRRGRVVRLGLVIVELGLATEEEIVQAINEHYKLSVTSLSDNIKERIGKMRGTFIERLPAPRSPIRLQLAVAIIFAILLTTLVLSIVILNRQKARLYMQTVKIGTVSLKYFEENARIPLIQDNILQLNTLIKNASDVEGLLYAVIVDNKKEIKAHTDPNMIGKSFIEPDDVKKVAGQKEVTYFDYICSDGKQALNLMQPITFKDKKLGEVHVGVSIDFIQQSINKERTAVILITLVILALGIVMALFLGYRFSKPISKLLHATEEISKGNYNYQVRLNRKDELGNLATAFNRMGQELWKNSLMQKSFGKYVGSEVLDMIAADPEKIWLRGHRNAATVFFADIRGFTQYSDEEDPEVVVEQLNEFFEIATKAIVQFGGFVDKFIGDAILGVFGVPIYRPDHVERAVRAAIYLQHKLKNTQTDNNRFFDSIGIGIDTGVLVSGNIGSQVKMEYTVIGDCVNVASRLNGLAGPGEIIISNSVYENFGDMIKVEALPAQEIKGKAEPINIYRVLSHN